VIDAKQVQAWIEELGYGTSLEKPDLIRIRPPEGQLPPFFVQTTENWVLLSILPVITNPSTEGLFRRLLVETRNMRLAKFALGKDDEVILCAELPTEALDRSELQDAVTRMVEYFERHREYLVTGIRPASTEGSDV
jgi:hypothetical protein